VTGYIDDPGPAIELGQAGDAGTDRICISKLTLTDFRNYKSAALSCSPLPCVLFGGNGAGKTNCLEAISLLTAGRGLRGLTFSELARHGGSGSWAVSAQLCIGRDGVQIGTGIQPVQGGGSASRTPRLVKMDGVLAKGSGALARVRMLWLTPAMDSLFTGRASERRRFLDRFVLSLDPSYANAAAAFERAMRQRNKALETFAPPQLLDALEDQMAEAAVQVATARRSAVETLAAEILAERDREPNSAFPWSEIVLTGHLESRIGTESPSDAGTEYRRLLRHMRERDSAAGRTLIGPHRSDLDVTHGPKGMAAKLCSTGEQKALLVGLILAQARLIKTSGEGVPPLILLDEVAAHLDLDRRLSLFSSIAALRAQVWMTGTDREMFAPLHEAQAAQFFLVSNGAFLHADDAESGSKH
jgi:DNA replication and repair protein RecF